MKMTIKTVLDVPVMHQFGIVVSEQWPCEIECNCHGREPRTHDYPGSPPDVEIVEVRFCVDGMWCRLDDPDSIVGMIPDVDELALSQLTQEILGRYDSEMEARLERQRDGD